MKLIGKLRPNSPTFGLLKNYGGFTALFLFERIRPSFFIKTVADQIRVTHGIQPTVTGVHRT